MYAWASVLTGANLPEIVKTFDLNSSLGGMLGYACTAKMVAELPPTIGEHIVASKDLWKYIERSPRPNIMVVQDLDQSAGKGCAWGDLAASIFLNLGCIGAITNGGVRDIREGDLIHADEHGVLTIPKEIPLEELLKVIKSFLASEKTVINYCARPGSDLDELVQHVSAHELYGFPCSFLLKNQTIYTRSLSVS